MTHSRPNLSTGDLDVLRRLEQADRDLGEIADGLFNTKGYGRKEIQRHEIARRLNGIKASLRTVSKTLGGEL